MFNVFEHPWLLIGVSIVFYFVLQIVRQSETNWWISNLLIILFVLALALNRFYGAFSPKNKFVIPLALLVLMLYETSLVIRAVLVDKKLWWLWTLPVFIAVTGIGLDTFVKSDMEMIKSVIYTGASAVENENPESVEAVISEDYSDSFHRSKASLMRHCRNILSRPLIDKIVPRITAINIKPPNADLICVSQISFEQNSYASQYHNQGMLITAKIELKQQANNQWLMNRIEITQINMYSASWSDIK